MEAREVIFGAFNGIGDILNAAPTIAAELRRGSKVVLLIFPNHQIHDFIELLDFKAFGGNLVIEELPLRGGPKKLSEFFNAMCRLDPDFVWISPHSPRVEASWKIPLLLWLIRRLQWRRAKLAGAQSEKFSWLFDVQVPIDRKLPFQAREWLAYSMASGLLPVEPIHPVSFVPELRRGIEPPLYDVLIHPGASRENRRWPIAYYFELIKRLPREYRIAVLGLPDDVAAIKSAMQSDTRVTFLSGTAREAIIAIGRAQLAITMDSSSRHIASLLGVPAITLFGPSDSRLIESWGPTVLPVIATGLACRPCEKKQCRYSTIYCMRMIEPARVAQTTVELLFRLREDPKYSQPTAF